MSSATVARRFEVAAYSKTDAKVGHADRDAALVLMPFRCKLLMA
jgi:hypothetical protein